MSTNTKPKIAFSFGLSKKPSLTNPSSSAPAPAKPTAFSFSKKPTPAAPLAKQRPANFGDDDSDNDDSSLPKPEAVVAISELDDDDLAAPPPTTTADAPKPKLKSAAPPPPTSKPKPKATATAEFTDLSSALTSQRYASAAAATDPSIYDYDAVYDSLKAAAHAKKADPADAEKRPRYFDALQKAADVRERDRQIAEEKRLKRERDAEGDEFADKEMFVTEAYKRQQEENRRIEAEEAAREAVEAKRNGKRGMADFYKGMLERGEREHQAVVKAVEEGLGKKVQGGEGEGEEVKTAAERAREINALGGNVVMNEDGEVVDKRQLLKGGLNIAPKKKAEVQTDKAKQAARGPSAAGIPARGVYNMSGGKNAMRERQTRMLEAQLEQSLKRAREEEEEDKAKIEVVAKSRKTEAEISSAKERFLARKKAAEEAKKKEAADGV